MLRIVLALLLALMCAVATGAVRIRDREPFRGEVRRFEHVARAIDRGSITRAGVQARFVGEVVPGEWAKMGASERGRYAIDLNRVLILKNVQDGYLFGGRDVVVEISANKVRYVR